MEKSTPTMRCGTQSRVGSACAIWGPPCARTWYVRTSATARKLWPQRASAAPCVWLQRQHQLPVQTQQQVNVIYSVTLLRACYATFKIFHPVFVLSCSCRVERRKLHGGRGALPAQRHLETWALSCVRLRQRRRHLWWGAVWNPVELREGCHTWGRVLPRVWQLRQCQQDDWWEGQEEL